MKLTKWQLEIIEKMKSEKPLKINVRLRSGKWWTKGSELVEDGE